MRKYLNKSKEYDYIKSIVVFIDILGFKSMVKNTGNNKIFGILFKIINELNRLDLPKIHLKGINITSISDSIVISVPYKEKASFEKIIRVLFVIVRLFIREDVLLRGAITIGDIYHRNGNVFGPALVEAYLLEKDCSVFPRIILKKSTIHEGLKTCKSDFGRDITIEKFRLDSDGMHFMII